MSLVNVEKRGRIAIVTIDNPPMNALSAGVKEELRVIFAELHANADVLAIILTGAGQKAFVAGADIKELPKRIGNPNLLPQFMENHNFFNSIDYSPKLTIAVINGYALGGGCELALTCDLRIAEQHAFIGVPEVKLGLLPGAGGTQRLPRLIGEAKAKELLFTGEHITADEAMRIGLVNRVVPTGEGLGAALTLAQKICQNSPSALQHIKKAVDEGMELPFQQALKLEAELFQDLFLKEDVKEGVQAFLEKRSPQFQGN
ncbi:enoyl-CoA hydratase/isomerase family protein [Brevibacillus sp. DP1.3A]|uniref:enoyl-CoA hydratase/isomerase family protein n=1 Tax=Brevibacillus sp. DP1.3A TaxID=2738867 RepID=UPI00156B5E9D|nr:enoyl-CoA hydratase [Brevibacillus sp. DP1.3A]UED72422.1 enoyl-CoA hydratase [Brevibacillus sp. DP1.3A]